MSRSRIKNTNKYEENKKIVKFDVQKAWRVVHRWCHQIEYRPLVTSHLKKLKLPYSLPDFVQIFTDFIQIF